jgi:hypothetical protein
MSGRPGAGRIRLTRDDATDAPVLAEVSKRLTKDEAQKLKCAEI